MVVSVLFVSLRFIYRVVIERCNNLGADDWITLATFANGVAAGLVHLYGSIPNGLGRDIWALEPERITNFGRSFYHACWTYFGASALIKLAVISLLMRIFKAANIRRLLWGTFVFTSLFGASYVITAIFQCRPIDYFWTKWDGLHTGGCADAHALVWTNAVIGIALDFWILAIPLWQLRHLQLHWKKKMAVAIMFLVGALYAYQQLSW